MGEAARRKKVGNTTPDKQWHGRKAADKHAKKVARDLMTAATANPIGTAIGLIAK